MCFEITETKKVETKTSGVRTATGAQAGFKIGDLVKILRVPTSADLVGWHNTWTPKMDAAVGQIGEVLDDYGATGCSVKVPSITNRNYYYPKSVLEAATSTPIPRSLVATNDPRKLEPDFALASKFVVGDKVRTHYPDYRSGREGLIATVLPTETSGYVYVRYESGNQVNLYPQRLTLVESAASITGTETAKPASVETTKKARGIAGAVKSHSAVFVQALTIAKELGKQNPTVNADQVQNKLAQLGYSSTDLGNAAGALFRGKSWKKVGTTKSARLGNHAREISNWQYIGA